MPIKEGYITEQQALEIASEHCGRRVCLKTVTNRRKELGAIKTNGGKWLYLRDAVIKAWPRGDAVNAPVKSIELSRRGGCGELHFHNCNVYIYITKE